jgi:hypothetical protein
MYVYKHEYIRTYHPHWKPLYPLCVWPVCGSASESFYVLNLFLGLYVGATVPYMLKVYKNPQEPQPASRVVLCIEVENFHLLSFQ